MTIFEKSTKLLANVEHYLLYAKKFTFFSFAIREIVLPFFLIVKGLEIAFRDFMKFYLLFIVIGGIGMVILDNFIGLNTPIAKIIFNIILFGMIFATIFSMPSSITSYGVKINHIQKIQNEFSELQIRNEDLQYIKINIENFQNKFKQRVNFFRTLLALSWAYNTFWISKDIDQIISNKVEVFAINNEMFNFSILIVLFMMLEFYKKGGEFIFKSIEFSLNEVILPSEDNKEGNEL